jgi:hypothetical protein
MMAVVDLADHHGGKKLKETNLPCALWPRRILSTGAVSRVRWGTMVFAAHFPHEEVLLDRTTHEPGSQCCYGCAPFGDDRMCRAYHS